MLTKLKGLSVQAKVAAAAAVAALLALGIGVAVWQPWNQPAEEPPKEPDSQQQEPATPQGPEEPGLSVKVNGEDVPCTLYEGTGWSVNVPEGWKAAPAGGNGAVFTSPEGGEMTVDFLPVDGGTGTFASLTAVGQNDRQLQFCNGGGEGSPVVTGQGPRSQWTRYEQLFAALARTLTVGTEKPFESFYILPQEPDWQEADGYTVLFLEKDGVILNDKAQEAVEEYMRAWPAEDRTVYTGQYRVNGIDWAADYTGLSDGYIDAFRLRVQYRVAEGGEEVLKDRDGVTVVDGWAALPESVYLVYDHGSERFRTVAAPENVDWISFAELL